MTTPTHARQAQPRTRRCRQTPPDPRPAPERRSDEPPSRPRRPDHPDPQAAAMAHGASLPDQATRPACSPFEDPAVLARATSILRRGYRRYLAAQRSTQEHSD